MLVKLINKKLPIAPTAMRRCWAVGDNLSLSLCFDLWWLLLSLLSLLEDDVCVEVAEDATADSGTIFIHDVAVAVTVVCGMLEGKKGGSETP